MPNKSSYRFVASVWRKIEQRLPIVAFLKSYSGSALLDDAIAGTTVALTVIPQSVAIAAVAGLPAQYGLYSAFINGFVYAIFGSVKEVSIGPTVVTAMLTQPYVLQFGPEVATTICIYSGIIVTLLGIFNLGFVVDLISTPVLAGFMSAAGLSVMTGQIPALLGIAGGGSNFLQYWIHIWKHAHEAHLWDIVLGVCCITVIFTLQYLGSSILRSSTKVQLLQRRAFTVPLRYISLGRNAIVVVVCTAGVAAITQSGRPSPVRVCGDIPVGLPSILLPRMTIWDANDTSLGVADTANYLLPSLVMPLNIIVESMMSANAFARGTSIDTSQELLAVGACNVIGSFFQSFSVAGSITRTAINHASNVRTTFGGVVTSAMVILSLVYLTAALKFLPNATLGAVVFCAVAFLVRIHIDAKRLWRSCSE
ncbi:hypothetical protein B566_EDAN013032 [Ephemera danica]|nr:hypothetical protein B566_EDAN013032 [Ephemera danica]